MFPERGGELLNESAVCQKDRKSAAVWDSRQGRGSQEDGRGVEGSEGTGTKMSC